MALVASLSRDQVAIGTGFSQLLRGVGRNHHSPSVNLFIRFFSIGQVGGLAAASALFQSRLDTELRARIHSPDADEVSIPHEAKTYSTDEFFSLVYPDHKKDSAFRTPRWQPPSSITT